MSVSAPEHRIVDYDSYDYDYRGFWNDRDYERWAESRVLNRLVRQLGRPRWLADFGGGFGRNSEHYLPIAGHSILIDYSITNLSRAAELHADAVAAGRLHLIRADLERLPLVDGAVDAAMVIRVLHHLTNVDAAIHEMGRTVGRRMIVDVPIKHHLLGRVRALREHRWSSMRSDEPIITGETDFPFHTFRLPVIRAGISDSGFTTSLAASVNNLRRWDRVMPARAVTAVRPAVYVVEAAAQRMGRGWWGPSQFLLATRGRLTVAPAGDDLADRLCCPSCHGSLEISDRAAVCGACDHSYERRREGFWNFVA